MLKGIKEMTVDPIDSHVAQEEQPKFPNVSVSTPAVHVNLRAAIQCTTHLILRGLFYRCLGEDMPLVNPKGNL